MIYDHDVQSLLTLDFSEKILKLNNVVSPYVQGYIVGVLNEFIEPRSTMIISESIVLRFIDAKQNPSFQKFQTIGDWLLWVGCMHPKKFESNMGVYTPIVKESYYTCWRFMNKKWPVYKELADDMTKIVKVCLPLSTTISK